MAKDADIMENVINQQREFFKSNKTKSISFRKEMLFKLKLLVKNNENSFTKALKADLNKSEYESYLTEISMFYEEVNCAIKKLKKWSRDTKVKTPLSLFKAKSFIKHSPYGVALVISPWNYPLLLSLAPIVSAVAAGNTVVLKPSEFSNETSRLIKRLFDEAFPKEYISVFCGDKEVSTKLLEQRFDIIFYTGSTAVGKIVMQAASKHLTPVVLELGGKSPVIVDETADLTIAARRIVFGKIINSGQTCVAPDYLLISSKVKNQFLELLKNEIISMLGSKPLNNPDYPKIITERHFNRLKGFLDEGSIYFGGRSDDSFQIEPTILCDVSMSDKIMQEEIFGPILPVIAFDDLAQAIDIIQKLERPLALYLFSKDKKSIEYILKTLEFGGGCVNDTILHLATSYLPFGGNGYSGMGSYHGKYGYKAFSHEKSIVNKSTKIDINLRYHPYTEKKKKLISKVLK